MLSALAPATPSRVDAGARSKVAELLLAVGLLYPTIKTIVAAFFSNDGQTFVGFNNFGSVLAPANQGLQALGNQVIWVIITPIIATAIGLAYAVFIDRSRGEKVLKVFVFMPVAISFVGASNDSSFPPV